MGRAAYDSDRRSHAATPAAVVCSGPFAGMRTAERRGQMPQIRELMTENPRTVQPDSTGAGAAKLMRDEDTGIAPITEGDGRLAGVVTDRDITIRVVADGKDATTTKVS